MYVCVFITNTIFLQKKYNFLSMRFSISSLVAVYCTIYIGLFGIPGKAHIDWTISFNSGNLNRDANKLFFVKYFILTYDYLLFTNNLTNIINIILF